MSDDIEILGGPLDHLSESGLKSLVRRLQSRIFDAEELSEERRKDLSQSEALVKSQTGQIGVLQAEVKRITEELGLQKETCRAGFIDRDSWKALAEKMAEALKNAKESNPAGLNTGIEEALQSFSDAKERGMK